LNRRRIALIATSLATTLIVLASKSTASWDAILNVNGQNLHLETFGASGPTVVFEAGLGTDAGTWQFVAGPIASFAQVVLYDRAGLGRSLPMIKTSSVTADAAAARLHALLDAADIRPPYLFVGHSLGGLYVQMFARKYPKEVSGVTLLDSSSPDAPTELKTRARLEPGTAAYLEEEGVSESNGQVKNGAPFPDVPLTVIAASDHGPSDWKEQQPAQTMLDYRADQLLRGGDLRPQRGLGDPATTTLDVRLRYAASTWKCWKSASACCDSTARWFCPQTSSVYATVSWAVMRLNGLGGGMATELGLRRPTAAACSD
jgi:pimeloyl-ACP methyl ester carboxylesterase